MIENKQVKEIYDRWNRIWGNREADLESRLKSYVIMKHICVLVGIYESNSELDDEQVDELFIKYDEDFKPILPEEIPRLLDSLRSE
ncbi:hypothetical protein [Halalkalibacter oceani]|uniref:hypothetical protein n=1 Tax=Halalkalibacter oceani TaxID=1653776 RepID=UPI00339A2722